MLKNKTVVARVGSRQEVNVYCLSKNKKCLALSSVYKKPKRPSWILIYVYIHVQPLLVLPSCEPADPELPAAY
jgi:hypothetical protein